MQLILASANRNKSTLMDFGAERCREQCSINCYLHTLKADLIIAIKTDVSVMGTKSQNSNWIDKNKTKLICATASSTFCSTKHSQSVYLRSAFSFTFVSHYSLKQMGGKVD